MKKLKYLPLIIVLLMLAPATQAQTSYNYGELLQKAVYFYDTQRSGVLPTRGNAPGQNRVEWRGDSAVNDGADVGVDLSGGFYDAGDHVKWGLPLAYSLTMMAWGADEFEQGYTDSGQLAYMLDNIRWGTDYLLKAHTAPNELWVQVGKAGPGSVDNDHSEWLSSEVIQVGRPSFKIDTTCPGSDVAAETAAALAAASIVFADSDPAYAAELITHAQQLYTFADTYRAAYSDHAAPAGNCLPTDHIEDYYFSWGGYQDELVWGAIWLYRATGDSAYLTKAETEYGIMGGIGGGWTHDWAGKSYGAALLLAQATNDAQYQTGMEAYLDWWLPGGGVTYTPGGLAYLAEWASLRYVSNTTMLAFIYSDYMTANGLNATKAAAYHDFAVDQINYALGDNPDNRSYVVGYGNNPPAIPHHTTAHGGWLNTVTSPVENRHVIYGALVGGPDQFDQAPGLLDRNDYVQNEIAISYNAAFVGSAARLYQAFGGAPLADFPPAEVRDDEIYVEARVINDSANFIDIEVDLINRSSWPAREADDLKARYYFTLDSGSISDVIVSNYSSLCAGATGPHVQDASAGLYYVEFDCTGTNIYPGGPTVYHQTGSFQIMNSVAWDTSNDPSYAGLTGSMAQNDQMTVYSGSTLEWGNVPTGATPIATATPTTAAPPPYSDAQYEVIFDITWSDDTHPHPDGTAAFPTGGGAYGPHFSGLVGAVHSSDVTFWELGGFASPGIEAVAESGNKTTFLSEIGAAGSDVWDTISASGMVVPNSLTVPVINVDTNNPLVTVASMLAPSPDWFVGVSNLSLWQNGAWTPTITIDLYPYDAGTKDGDDYEYNYPATNPQQPIALITGQSPFSSEPLGTLTFNLLGVTVTPMPTETPTATPAAQTPTATPTAVPVPVSNLLLNGDFANGVNPWWQDAAAGSAATGGVTNGEFCMTVTAEGTNVWDILFGQSDLSLAGGEAYTISFNARGSLSAASLWVGENIAPAYPTFMLETFTPSAEMQPYTYTFTPANSSTAVGLDFQIGNAGTGDFCVDDVVLTSGTSTTPLTVSLQNNDVAPEQMLWLPVLLSLAVVTLGGAVIMKRQ